MLFADYIKETEDNARDAIREYLDFDPDTNADKIADMLFVDDSVTGNSSGSFFCNSARARECVDDLVWDRDFIALISDERYGRVPLEFGPESIDVMARCLALGFIDVDALIDDVREDMQA